MAEFAITNPAKTSEDREGGNTKHFDDPIQSGLNFFKDDPLVAQPGTSFHYSTQGYTLVGCVIEGASGGKYVDFMRQNVLVPAQMEQTQADDRFAIIPYRTRFYEKKDSGAVRNSDFLDSSYKIPGGGWLSSAEDMARFEVAILNDKLIHRATRDLMWSPLKPSDGLQNTYGLGWGWGKHNEHEVADVGTTLVANRARAPPSLLRPTSAPASLCSPTWKTSLPATSPERS